MFVLLRVVFSEKMRSFLTWLELGDETTPPRPPAPSPPKTVPAATPAVARPVAAGPSRSIGLRHQV